MPLFRRIYVYLGTPKNCGNSVYEGIELESKSVREIYADTVVLPPNFCQRIRKFTMLFERVKPPATP